MYPRYDDIRSVLTCCARLAGTQGHLMGAGRTRDFGASSGIFGTCYDPPSAGSEPLAAPRNSARCPSICSTDLTSRPRRREQSLTRSTIVSTMIDQLLTHFSPLSIAAVTFVALIARLLYNRYGTGLNHIPGPFFASFTNFYRLAVARGYRPERWHIKLREQYGDFVRIGPRTVLCSSNKAAKKIYALNAGFVKVSICEPE
jgi:hypothetical protein